MAEGTRPQMGRSIEREVEEGPLCWCGHWLQPVLHLRWCLVLRYTVVVVALWDYAIPNRCWPWHSGNLFLVGGAACVADSAGEG